MLKENTITRSAEMSASRSTVGWVIAISIAAGLALWMAPPYLFSEDIVPVVVVAALFALLLVIVLGLAITRHQPAKVTVYRLTLLMWWVILVCEAVFDRMGDSTQAYQSNFSVEAYGEGVVWVLAFLTLGILSIQQPDYIRRVFSGPYKWVTFFAVVCAGSVAYSTGKSYSGAWAFKLVLVVLLLQLGASMLTSLADVVTFLKVTLWGFFVLAIVPTVQALSDTSTAFEGVGGRLNASPDALTNTAGLLLLLSVILYSIEKQKMMIVTGLLASAVMLMSLGKSAILASLIAIVIFFLLQKQVGRSAAVLLGITAVGLVVLSVTPVGAHLQSYEGAATLTGRTAIWTEGVNAVRQKWLLGHGYLSTYFSWSKNSGLAGDYTHLHNGFLEVAYNNGLIGLAILLMIHFMILRNAFRSIRDASILRARRPYDKESSLAYILAVGFLALYANLTINGLFNTTFGGRARSAFMLFLALFVMADLLRRHITKMVGGTVAEVAPRRSDWFPAGVPERR
jgi:exopolysaccharide production protein ExoQ